MFTLKVKMPAAAPIKKVVVGAVAGAGLGGPLSVIVVWLITSFGVAIPPEVAAAMSSVIAICVAFIASYITPPSASEVPISAPT